MKNQRHSIDGISLRRRTSVGRLSNSNDEPVPRQFLKEGAAHAHKRPDQLPRVSQSGLSRSDIDESLRRFDDEPGAKKSRRWRPSKKFFKRFFILIFVIIILIGGFIGVKALIAGSNIFGGNLFDLLSQPQALKTDANGRSNVLVFGTSEDDVHQHDGASLTDSIMLMSVDQKTKQVAITSVPRDLWVDFDTDCEFGNAGKINVVYECAAGSTDPGQHSDTGSLALMKKVGEVYGVDMQYYVHVNYTALQQTVDAVGGVDVKIESSDPRGILDRNFDWECNYNCYYVKYPNGPAHLDGKHALMLARARNDAGGYGLSGGNFDREKNQQKILVALKNKAASAGTLANPIAATQLIDSIGGNVRTNFVSGEIKTLIGLANNVKDDQIDRIDLNTKDNPLFTTGSYSGQSIVRPIAGITDYSDIQAFIRKRLSGDVLGKEAATVMVLNGSGQPGAAQTMEDKLVAQGFSVDDIGNAVASADYGKVSVYKISKTAQPATQKKLEKLLKAKTKPGPLPYGMVATTDFVVIVGQ
jgi:polyisoprenyl-teichoic acid--peptidoglycan teichoic acid transferase